MLRTREVHAKVKVQRHALRIIRERSGLSVPQLAQLMEPPVSHGTIYDIENGNRGASPEMAKRLAAALKVPLVTILADPEPTGEDERVPA